MNLGNIKQDRRGGIEGLPLQLMIVILVATMGTAIIVGWMGSIDTPQSIGDVEIVPEGVTEAGFGELTVTVTDQDGEYLPGATVILQGLNVTMPAPATSETYDEGTEPTDEATGDAGARVTPYGTTDSNGRVTFGDLEIHPAGSASVGYITVIVSKPGYGEHSSTRLTVIL